MPWYFLLPLGVVVGLAGTIIGAGGGFILTPLLLLWHPGDPPERITALSLFVVMCNATSGTIGYARQGKVDFRAGVAFALTGIPGAILGAAITHYVSRPVFDPLMGAMLLTGSLFLIWRSRHPFPNTGASETRLTRDRLIKGTILSFGIGVLAALLGIGGGIVHVPLLIYWLHYTVHRAAATSHFVLALTAMAAVGTHITRGELSGRWDEAIPLGIGAVIGAQIGAALAPKLRGGPLVVGLAVALGLVAARLIWRGLG
ncbi:MAG TPA: sulfite exporter TauE/SafE family protein [Phycisphaerales bacterium]|nr:sulfite exporter TauE/SafE family protein [Phycisphaerales bacterium]